MGKILIKEKEVAVPGETVAQGMDILPSRGTFRHGEDIVSTLIGLPNIKDKVISIIPLSGPYLPRRGDQVIGIVTDVTFYGWTIDIGSPYAASLSVKDAVSEYVDMDRVDLSRFFNIGDLLVAKIIKKEKSGFMKLTTKGPGLKKLHNGKLVKVSPPKIPRLIGKQGSMINMIKNKTDTIIIAGQNGWVWIHGEPTNELQAAKAIELIEKEGHIQGLTDKIEKMLGS